MALLRLAILPPLPCFRRSGHMKPQLYADAYNSTLLALSCPPPAALFIITWPTPLPGCLMGVFRCLRLICCQTVVRQGDRGISKSTQKLQNLKWKEVCLLSFLFSFFALFLFFFLPRGCDFLFSVSFSSLFSRCGA